MIGKCVTLHLNSINNWLIEMEWITLQDWEEHNWFDVMYTIQHERLFKAIKQLYRYLKVQHWDVKSYLQNGEGEGQRGFIAVVVWKHSIVMFAFVKIIMFSFDKLFIYLYWFIVVWWKPLHNELINFQFNSRILQTEITVSMEIQLYMKYKVINLHL